MGEIKYYPKSASNAHGVAVWYPTGYTTSKQYMVVILCHGIGECGDESEAQLKRTALWGSWANAKTHADQLGFILVFVQTPEPVYYKNKEIQYGISWTEANLPVNRNLIWLQGQSLGGGPGDCENALTDIANVCSKIAGVFVTSSGPYNNTLLYNNIINNKIRIWGGTAANDGVVSPVYVRQLYSKIKAIDANYPVLVTEFAGNIWSSSQAHIQPLARMSSNMYGVEPANTNGLEKPVKMNLYQWMLSNPRGSAYKPPSDTYAGTPLPEPEPPQPTFTQEFVDIMCTWDGKWTVKWKEISTGVMSYENVTKPTTETIDYLWTRPVSTDGKYKATVRMKSGLEFNYYKK